MADTVDPKRDLATVGGGNIPGNNADPTDVEKSVPAQSHGIASNAPKNANTIDPQAQGNLGGRNPGTPQTAMGDQDATQGNRPDTFSTEPMTSRAPDKVHSQDKQQGSDDNK